MCFCTAMLNFCLANELNNGSFEDFVGEPNGTVTLNGWRSSGVAPEVYNTYVATRNLYVYYAGGTQPSEENVVNVLLEPNDGQYFLRLQSDYPTDQPGTQLTQTIDVNAGQCIRGVYYFDAEDYMPYDDTATIMLMPVPDDPLSGPYEIILAQKNISDPHISDYGGMPDWESFSHDFNDEDAGRYTLVLKIGNGQDHALPSYLLVDSMEICSSKQPVCYYKLAGDMNKDCKVDFLDFATIVANWLVDCNAEPLNEACE